MSTPPAVRRPLPRTRDAAVRTFLGAFSPRVLVASSAAALGLRAGLGDFGPLDLLLVAAIVLVWPLQEWLIHVFILHFRPRQVLGVWIDPATPRSHRAHHADPWDLGETWIPRWVHPYALPLAAAIWLGLAPSLALGATGLATYLLMATHYEWCHYIAHIPWTPDLRFYKELKRAHLNHHFRDEKQWWGVSMRLADRLLGTGPDASTVAPSPTCRAMPGGPRGV
jgi:hypothetical protein